MRWCQARAAAVTHPLFFGPAPRAYLQVKLRAGEMMCNDHAMARELALAMRLLVNQET